MKGHGSKFGRKKEAAIAALLSHGRRPWALTIHLEAVLFSGSRERAPDAVGLLAGGFARVRRSLSS